MATTLVRKLLLQITADDADAETKLDAIHAKADELRTLHPELSVKLDTAEANAKMAVLREELKREAGTVKVKVEPDVSQFRELMSKAGSWLMGGQTTNAGGGIGGILSTIVSTGPVGIGALVAAIGASLTELAGLVAGLTAAGAGVGAFALLALPTFDKIKNAYTAINTAQAAYNTALTKEKLDPTKANATAVATALLNLKVAQEQAGPAASKAVSSIQQLMDTFHKMSSAFQPTALKVFNDALAIANTLLPTLKPFADAAGGAIDGLLKKAETFFQSADFKKWLDKFLPLVGPSITAIGTGFGKVAQSVGRLLTVMSAHDVVHALNIAFDIINDTIRVLTGTVRFFMTAWDQASSHIASFARAAGRDLANWAQVVDNIVGNVVHWFEVTLPVAIATAIIWFEGLPGKILSALSSLGGMLFSAGQHAVQRLIDGLGSMIGSLGHMAASLASKIAGFFGLSPAKEGPLSGGGAPEIRGAHFVAEFARGMQGGMPAISRSAATAAAAAAGAGAAAGGYGGYGGGGVRVQLEFAPGSDQRIISAFKQSIRVRGGDPLVIGR